MPKIKYDLIKDFNMNMAEICVMLGCNPRTAYKWLQGAETPKCKLMTIEFAEKTDTDVNVLRKKYNLK